MINICVGTVYCLLLSVFCFLLLVCLHRVCILIVAGHCQQRTKQWRLFVGRGSEGRDCCSRLCCVGNLSVLLPALWNQSDSNHYARAEESAEDEAGGVGDLRNIDGAGVGLI